MSTPRKDTFAIAPFAFSVEDAGAYLALSPRGIENLIRAGRLPSIKVGTRRVLRRVDLERLLNAQVEDHYVFRVPETIREALVADAELQRLASVTPR
jgi:excisionase family DNA binding protein